jgi:hypothetical protein
MTMCPKTPPHRHTPKHNYIPAICDDVTMMTAFRRYTPYQSSNTLYLNNASNLH